MKFHLKTLITTTLISLILISCSTTSVKHAWLNPELSNKSFSNVLVIGVHKDSGVRTEYEVKLTTALKNQGINAIAAASIKELNGKRTKEQVVKLVQENNYDTVLVTKYQALKQEEIYKPGYTEYQLIGYRGFFDPFYGSGLIEIHHPGYTVDRETLYLEVSIFETSEGAIVWRGMTASINPNSNNVIDDVVKAISNKVSNSAIYAQ